VFSNILEESMDKARIYLMNLLCRSKALWPTGLLLLLLSGSIVLAQSGYSLPWFTISSGGGISSAGPYTLSGTIGQSFVGVLSGGPYTLASGFWPGVAAPGPITAITLVSFSASGRDDQVTLDWQTASETDNEGFNLWRAETAAGPYAQINPSLIPAQGSPDTGASYQYVDGDVLRGQRYYYRLEDVDIHGVSAFHGPVSATASSFQDIYLPLIYKE
jgi:hypothetical protein